MALLKAKELVSTHPVVLFSKTGCYFCDNAKDYLTKLGVSFKVIELDKEGDGHEIESALIQWTKQPNLPNIFIGGKHIGGCGAAMALHNEGKLVPLLTEAGVVLKASD